MRDVIERTILGAIYAWSTTPADAIAAAKAEGIDVDAFSTIDRRLVWLIAENSTSRERAVKLVRLAVEKAEIDQAFLWLIGSWGESAKFFGYTTIDRIHYRCKQLREITLSSSRPTVAAALAQLKGKR